MIQTQKSSVQLKNSVNDTECSKKDILKFDKKQRKLLIKSARAYQFLKECKYNTKKFLGRGKFGFVFKCENPQGREVATKVVVSDYLKTLMREISIHNNFQKLDWAIHIRGKEKSIVNKNPEKSYNSYVNIGEVKVVDKRRQMAIIELPLMGSDISQISFRSPLNNERVDYKELRKIAKRILKVIFVLNENGISHFDIKPQNILMTRTPSGSRKYQLADFGLARSCKVKLENGETLRALHPGPKRLPIRRIDSRRRFLKRGTKAYMAPELLSKDSSQYCKLDGTMLKKADIFSLGLTIFKLYLNSRGMKNNSKRVREYLTDLHTDNFVKESNNDEQEENLLDFVKYLTALDLDKRPNAEQALKHKFLQRHRKAIN